MTRDLVVYRRDLPGGRIVMISIDERDPTAVVGHLLVERRTDPSRRTGEPPVVAEVRGATRAEVLASLRALAESEREVGERLDAWVTSRSRGSVGGAGGGGAGASVGARDAVAAPAAAAAGARVRMPDGTWWSVERRHEMTQLSLGPSITGGSAAAAAARHDRALFLFFHGGDGALRRAAIPEDFPERPSDAELWGLWERAVVLR